MSLAREFRETIRARIERDPAFREELLKEGVECLLSGAVDTGKAVLRDYITATLDFQELGGLTAKSPKSLMRMFGPNGNPQTRNLFRDHRPPSGTRRVVPQGPSGSSGGVTRNRMEDAMDGNAETHHRTGPARLPFRFPSGKRNER